MHITKLSNTINKYSNSKEIKSDVENHECISVMINCLNDMLNLIRKHIKDDLDLEIKMKCDKNLFNRFKEISIKEVNCNSINVNEYIDV